ncbi:MAG: serine acetyltransferase [Bacteroidia bacterium]|nr:serine acetyltransferase [Bacteroidia bacterium]
MKNKKDNQFGEWTDSAVRSLVDAKSFDILCHKHRTGESMPSTEKLRVTVEKIRQIVFPGYFGEINLKSDTLPYYMGVLVDEVYESMAEQIFSGLCFICENEADRDLIGKRAKAEKIAYEFVNGLAELRRILITDVNAAYLGDPAANSVGEVIFCYPAIRAISSYRIAHCLFTLGVPLIPRIITEMAHSETGIDINPEAVIGEYFTIDHGTGVVIGSTSIIGKNVKVYQGVTLGAKSFPLDENGNPVKGIPRHPIIEDNVVIYSSATILGRITIGHDSVIGGNIWVTNDLPPYSKVVQNKTRNADFFNGGGI